MTTPCDRFQEQLAEQGVRDAELVAHLESCAGCARIAALLGEVSTGLAALPAIEPPDKLVERTLAATRRSATAPPLVPLRRAFWIVHPRLVGVGIAAAFVLAILALNMPFFVQRDRQRRNLAEMYTMRETSEGAPRFNQQAAPAAPPPPATIADPMREEAVAGKEQHEAEPGDKLPALGHVSFAAPESNELLDRAVSEPQERQKKSEVDRLAKNDDLDAAKLGKDSYDRESFAEGSQSTVSEVSAISDELRFGQRADHPASTLDSRFRDQKSVEESKRVAGAKPAQLEKGGYDDAPAKSKAPDSGAPASEASGPAQSFLAERERVDGLHFQEARGYWRNTYLPGDPETRLLTARVAERDPASPALGVRPYGRPFDAPQDSALALYLHSDRAAVEGRTRALVEVGIKGAQARATRRPEMSVALVLDLRSLPEAADQGAIRALVSAFAQSREGGDRFSLTLAGVPGGMVVGPDEFRNGPIAVALDGAFRQAAASSPSLDLGDAIEVALKSVARADDPKAPIGASSVVLVTASSLGSEVDRLTRLAHAGAVNGIPLSLVAVGDDVPAHEVQRLALAGQGRRHLLSSLEEARALAGRELHAAAQSVARALRLSIRLARGVELVGIVGSQRLGNADVKRVREAEQSIDQRLARSLGIAADREQDEAGIQIVIPAFQAGDEHAILLDVVVDRPGPVAEVSLRYKDLARLDNAVARASLSLPQGQRAAGPLERGVRRDYLGARVAETLRAAARLVAEGDPVRAAAGLEQARQLLVGVMGTVAGGARDAELEADALLLARFADELRGTPAPDRQALLADALRLASLRKISPPFDHP